MQLFDTQGRRLYTTAEERAAFMAAARKAAPEVRTLCAVLHDSGCRESELLEVTPERVDRLCSDAIVRKFASAKGVSRLAR